MRSEGVDYIFTQHYFMFICESDWRWFRNRQPNVVYFLTVDGTISVQQLGLGLPTQTPETIEN